uniref:Uncharacterized protein n=1 Tax=Magallana gigas TaxID=29159 RepID=A0A8W8P7N3_MAGGI
MSRSGMIGMSSHNMPPIVNPILDATSALSSHIPTNMNQGKEEFLVREWHGCPGGMVVEPDGLEGAQGRDTVAWEGFKSDWNDQLCGLSSPFSPPGCAGEVEVSLPQGCNGGGTARDIDSAGDRHARNVGTVQGDPMLMARLEALEFQLAQVTQLLIGLSGSVVGSCSQGRSPREDNNSIRSTPVRGMLFPILVTLGSQQQLLGV